jgi:serine/threonine protein kinase
MEQPRITSIGRYEILSEIARDGMGAVYRAQDSRMGRQVAIKTVTKDLTMDAAVLQRLYLCFKPIGMLDHPNIIPVYEIGDSDGQFYIVMQFNEGDPLDRLIRGERRLPLLETIDIVSQICAGLGYAHVKGVIHGGVKSSNRYRSELRQCAITGFLHFATVVQPRTPSGVSSLPRPGKAQGPFLRWPIRYLCGWRGLLSDAHRQPAFRGPLDYLTRLINDKHLPLIDFLGKYPAALDDILNRSLAKDPANRYQSADEMAADLCTVVEALKHEATVQ